MVDPLKGILKPSIEKLNRHGQMKHVDSSGKSSKHHFPHETLSSRSGKALRDIHKDDVHLKISFLGIKKMVSQPFDLHYLLTQPIENTVN